MNGFDPARIAMLTTGSGLLVGSVTIDGDPHTVRAWSAELVDPSTARIRVAVCADDPLTLPSVDGRLVAVTAADVRTVESVQVKGRAFHVGPPNDHDLDVIEHQSEAFLLSIQETDGDPVEYLRRMKPNSYAMVEVEVTEIYDQTPGPRAGTKVETAMGPMA